MGKLKFRENRSAFFGISPLYFDMHHFAPSTSSTVCAIFITYWISGFRAFLPLLNIHSAINSLILWLFSLLPFQPGIYSITLLLSLFTTSSLMPISRIYPFTTFLFFSPLHGITRDYPAITAHSSTQFFFLLFHAVKT